MVIGKGLKERFLTEEEIREVFAAGLASLHPAGRTFLFILPDSTRSGPIPLCFRIITDLLQGVAAKVDFIIALGTHRQMDEATLERHVGISAEERTTRYAQVGIFNHNWQAGLKHIGDIPEQEIRELSQGMMSRSVSVDINSRLFDYDHVVIVGPVFPHEVVGFSGGNKYFFPGVSGADVIDLTHWLSALITSHEIIGTKYTPVRRVLDRAASLITVNKSCFSMVVKGHDDLAGLYFGTPEESQAAAADLSSVWNIRWVDKPFQKVLSVMPELYDDIWTASKGMFKVEPAVADGGTVIIYAPHIDEISYTHGVALDRIGYHVRDYYLKHWDRYGQESGGVMAHACHLKGPGTYENGIEKPRVNIILATGVPRERCERVNLGYMDPATVHPEEWAGREDEGILYVPRAGEMLFRVKGI